MNNETQHTIEHTLVICRWYSTDISYMISLFKYDENDCDSLNHWYSLDNLLVHFWRKKITVGLSNRIWTIWNEHVYFASSNNSSTWLKHISQYLFSSNKYLSYQSIRISFVFIYSVNIENKIHTHTDLVDDAFKWFRLHYNGISCVTCSMNI